MPGIHVHTSQACQGIHTGRIYVIPICDICHKPCRVHTYMNQSLTVALSGGNQNPQHELLCKYHLSKQLAKIVMDRMLNGE